VQHPDLSSPIGLIAGRGVYPAEWIGAARKAGVAKIILAAFEGETDPALFQLADAHQLMRVGQLNRLIAFFKNNNVTRAVMCGQIRPARLFDLRPDLRALFALAKLKRRNAETLFRAVADELARDGITLLPANVFMEESMITPGRRIGRAPRKRELDDVAYGFELAKKISELDIGQTVVVKRGTVLAVEAFEGTNDALRRGGALSGGGGAVAVKVSKPAQDFRFDIPVIGPTTLEVAAQSGISVVALESGKTLLLEVPRLNDLAARHDIAVLAWPENSQL
jgi:DUF1009 family protein